MPRPRMGVDADAIRPFRVADVSLPQIHSSKLPPTASTPQPRRSQMLKLADAATPSPRTHADVIASLSQRFLTPPSYHEQPEESSSALEHVIAAFRQTMDYIAQHAVKSGERTVSEAYESFASHIKRYKHDDDGVVVRNICDGVLQHGVSAGDFSTRASTSATLVVLDQLLSLLVSRIADVASVVDAVRPRLHSLIFPTPPPIMKGSGGTADPYSTSGLPRVCRVADDGLIQQLEQPFLHSLTFAEASAKLLTRLDRVGSDETQLRRRLSQFTGVGTRFARIRIQSVLAKAFTAWRGSVVLSRAFGRYDSDVVERRQRLAGVEASLTNVSAKRQLEKHAASLQINMLSTELHTARMHFEAHRAIAVKTRVENDGLKAQVADLQRGAVLRLQQRIGELESELESWRNNVSVATVDAANNTWELYNRRRGQNTAMPIQNGGAGRRGQNDIAYPPLTANAARAIAVAEELAGPFATLVFGALALSAAAAEASKRSTKGSKKSIAASGARASQASKGSNLHAVTPHTTTHVLCLLHAVSPGHLSLSDVRRLAAGDDPKAVGQRITTLCSELGVPMDGIPAASIPHLTKPQLELLVCSIIARYAGVAAISPLLPPIHTDCQAWCEIAPGFAESPFSAAAELPGMLEMSTKTPMVSVKNTNHYLSATASRVASIGEYHQTVALQGMNLSRWKAWGSAVVSDAIAAALTAAEGGVLEPPLTVAQLQHVAEFRLISPTRFESYPVTLDTDTIDTLQTEVLSEANARGLRRVFVFYASGGAGKVDMDSRMSLEEFEAFLNDSRIVANGSLTKEAAVALFKESARPDAPQSPSSATSGNTNGNSPVKDSELQLGPAGFVEFLVRCADAVSRAANRGENAAFDRLSAPDPSVVMSMNTPVLSVVPENQLEFSAAHNPGGYAEAVKSALAFLIEDCVLYNCNGGTTSEGVVRMLRSKQVAELLATEKPSLRKLFRVYCAADSATTAADQELLAKEYITMLVNAGIISQTDAATALQAEGLTPKEITAITANHTSGKLTISGLTAHQLYYRVLELSSDPESGRGGMRFDSFNEVLCALAMCVSPSPFSAPHHRLRHLLEVYLLPLAENGAPVKTRGPARSRR